MNWILETDRLKLREIEKTDLDTFHTILSNPETMSFYPTPYSRSDTQHFIEKNIERYESIGCGLWAIILKSGNRLIGDCGITIQNIDGVDEYEIGYHLHKNYWGNGFATEAAKAVKRYGFNHLNLQKLCSYMAADHLSSRMVAERNGMKLEKTFNNPRNRNFSTVVYSILKEET